MGDELLYIEGPTVEEVNENENYGDVEDIGGANASVEDDAVVDNDDAIGEANIEQSEQERRNNFFDPEYDIVNGDEDLISVLVETGQLKVGSTARAGQNEAQGGDQVGEEHTEADRETEAQEQPEVDAGEAQVEQTVQEAKCHIGGRPRKGGLRIRSGGVDATLGFMIMKWNQSMRLMKS